jgi:hypothetical protein
MSHVVSIETEIRDISALHAACRRLGLTEPTLETTQLFSGEATGYCVRLPEWRYPVVCDLANGKIAFDNYGGHWGEQRQFDTLLQAYAAESVKLQARRQGHSVCEQSLADGSLKLTVEIGGDHEND